LPPPTLTTGSPGLIWSWAASGVQNTPGALESVQAGRVELAVGHAGGDDHGTGGELASVVETDDVVVVVSGEPGCGLGYQ
jgi:hypothetical protein